MSITLYVSIADYLPFASGINTLLVASITPAGIAEAQFTFDLDKYSIAGTHLSKNKVVVKRRKS